MAFLRCNEGSSGGGGSDFIGQNQYMVVCGDNQAAGSIGNDVFDYTLNSDIAGHFGTHNQTLIANVTGHSSAEVTTASKYDGVFGYKNGVVTVLANATSQAAATTLTIDITSYDYLILVSGSYSGRKIVVTS